MARFNRVRKSTMTRPKAIFPVALESLEVRQMMSIATPHLMVPVDPTGMISGAVYADLNHNGLRDAGETGVAGVTIYLDANNNGQMDESERSTVTDNNGEYAFITLTNGRYNVRQIVPADSRQTAPDPGDALRLVVRKGQPTTGADFGDQSIAGLWNNYGGNAQHTGLSSIGSQPLNQIAWQTPVDLQPQLDGEDISIHYGEPVFTTNNVMILPVKTGPDGGFELQGRSGVDGTLLWTVHTDYVLPPNIFPLSFSPCLTPDNRVYFATAGGTISYFDNADQPGDKTLHQLAYYGLNKYLKAKANLDAHVFVNTPLTVDDAGNIFFGVQADQENSRHLRGGLARIAANGTGKFLVASTAAGTIGIQKVAQNCAPALSNDGKIVYVAMNLTRHIGGGGAPINLPNFLFAIDSTTLAVINKVALIDPNTKIFAQVSDTGSASPMIGPDGDVYFGALESAGIGNNGRGWMLHFDRTLTHSKPPGAFGWDDTASVVPASMVPSYHGSSAYLIMSKYNNYVVFGGDGVNKLAILDPNDTFVDPVSGVSVMREVLTIAGVTPDPAYPDKPGAVKEWCINTAVVDPATGSILAGSEDGKLYRWDLASNSFTQVITITSGIGEAYTPTLIGPDGTVYAINNATLFAVR